MFLEPARPALSFASLLLLSLLFISANFKLFFMCFSILLLNHSVGHMLHEEFRAIFAFLDLERARLFLLFKHLSVELLCAHVFNLFALVLFESDLLLTLVLLQHLLLILPLPLTPSFYLGNFLFLLLLQALSHYLIGLSLLQDSSPLAFLLILQLPSPCSQLLGKACFSLPLLFLVLHFQLLHEGLLSLLLLIILLPFSQFTDLSVSHLLVEL